MRKFKENMVAGCSLEGTCRTLISTTFYKSNAKLCLRKYNLYLHMVQTFTNANKFNYA